MDPSSLRQLNVSVRDGDFSIEVRYDHMERSFDDKNRMLILYSEIDYKAENFEWSSVLPVVKIPYQDPALGFLVDGVLFSTVGIYSRAPGIVPDMEVRSKTNQVPTPKVDIVNTRNSTITIGYRRNAVKIIFKRGREKTVPIGIFLKALSGLPYSTILDKFAYKPQELLNGFPCEIPKGNVDLSRVPIYGADGDAEPTIEECIDEVYKAIIQVRDDAKQPNYTTHWKVNRILAFFNSLHFKSKQKYESTMSVGNRAVGTYLDADIRVPYFKKNEHTVTRLMPDGTQKDELVSEEVVDEFFLPKGHYITDDDAREIRRYNIHTLRVRTNRSFVLQEVSPLLFRALGYKLASPVPGVHCQVGEIIDEELLRLINDTDVTYLDVFTPAGREVLHRSDSNVCVGDFCTILNVLFTDTFTRKADTTQYEVSNRVILNYDHQVRTEIEQTYSDIISSVMGSNELKNLLDSFPALPSNRLAQYLRDAKHKEIAQSDITNVMSRAIAQTKASALMKATPQAMMPVQLGQYGRLDSFHAPDSDKVGSVQQTTVLARVNEATGEIEAPYEKVVKGRPTGNIVYLSAAKEKNKYIVAWNDNLVDSIVMARYNSDITTVDREKVDYRDPSPFCDMSVSRMCIPFPGFSQPKRALMATKMNGQAIPVLFPERPIVATGAETEIPGLYYTGRNILEECSVDVVPGEKLELIGHQWQKNLVEYRFIYCGEVLHFSIPFTATDKESLYNYNLNLNGSNYYDVDEVIFYNQCCDLGQYEYWTRMAQGAVPCIHDHTKPAMALGVNLRCCYKTYGSCTVDDAILISDRLVADRTISSIQIFKYTYKLHQNESYPETGWCVPEHHHVYVSQPVIQVERTKNNGQIVRREVFCKHEGEVIYAHKDASTGEAEVWVMTLHDPEVGDKMAGRYGNKSVIAKIVPDEMMPYDPETGETMDIVFTPLGLPSRMNYGQIIEVALGAAMGVQGKCAICTPFYPGIKEDVIEEYERCNLKPKRLFNPVYGKLTERPVMTGIIYMMKLEQMSNLKLFVVGYPTAVDPVFGQPVDSVNQKKGQAIGEMESWAFIASGSNKILNALYTLYADDEKAREEYFKALEECMEDESRPWDESFIEGGAHSVNKNALVTQTAMRMLGCDISVVDNKYVISPLKLSDIPVRISAQEFMNGNELVDDYEWTTVPLAAPVINPFWIQNFPLQAVLGVKSVKTLVDQKSYLNRNIINNREDCVVPASELADSEKRAMITGIDAVIELIRNTTVEEAIERIKRKYDPSAHAMVVDAEDNVQPVVEIFDSLEDAQEASDDGDKGLDIGDLSDMPVSVADVLRFLEKMYREGRELDELIWDEMPIMPRVFRQNNLVGDRERKHSFQMQLEAICSSRATSQGVYEGLKALIGYSAAKQDDLISVRGYFFGKDSQSGQHGKVRSAVLTKRVGFSGRVVIVPMEDPSIPPFFVGLPWRAVVIELGKILGMRLAKRSDNIAKHIAMNTDIRAAVIIELSCVQWQAIVESLGEFNPYLLSKYLETNDEQTLYFVYNYLRSIVRELVEGDVRNDGYVMYNGEYVAPETLPDNATIDCAVVESGRQPTLHKKSTRSYFVKLVDGYCMRIHPIVCAAYNADFDGDTMWHLQLLGQMKVEACKTTSILQDLISEKDGSYTLALAQDVALGIYCATTLENNAAEFVGRKDHYYFCDDLEELRAQLEYGDLHYYDPVVFYNTGTNSYYMSTAGRILVNGCIPDGFTVLPFSDPLCMCKQVLGEETVSQFKELRHDMVWVATDEKAKGRENTIKLDTVLLDTYRVHGPRTSVLTAQALYEVGLIASDVYSVSITLDDLSTSVDTEVYMEEPREIVSRLNSLYQLGLITEESRKQSSVRAWDAAKKAAQKDIIDAMDPTSNIFYMLYSGARGKPAQVMQSVGFIGNISKTKDTDIEYPILKGYGAGLSSLELAQTRETARIGIISTQSGTKDTGYATRQSVYMTSGMITSEEDCGISMRLLGVEYAADDMRVKYPDGRVVSMEDLDGEFVDPDTEGFEVLRGALNTSGYMINESIRQMILDNGIRTIKLLDTTVELVYKISDAWRQWATEEVYSYALPYTKDMLVTDKTVDWIEQHGLREVIGFEKSEKDENTFFDLEAYLPVEYDTLSYKVWVDGKTDEEELYTRKVSDKSEGFHYYRNMLTPEGLLTEKAVRYLTKKKLRSIDFEDGTRAVFRYSLSQLFKSVVRGRDSAGLPFLDMDHCITDDTLKEIEQLQLDAIPVRTGLTCLTPKCICSKCYGKLSSSGDYSPVGYNIGIAASQAMCEPLSQSTLNVAHTGGQRKAGIGLESGLDFYKNKMLKGTMTTNTTAYMLERFAPHSGVVRQNPHNKSVVTITDDVGVTHQVRIDDPDRLNVPDGAYVDADDTLFAGLTDLNRYSSTNIFDSALRTRYLLMREYDKVFSTLDVSARNSEVMARAQTSLCYAVGKGATSKTKDTSTEARDATNCYKLTVSAQPAVVANYSGIASYAFENVANMLLNGIFTPGGLELNSSLGNLVTGTEVGSREAKFIDKRGGGKLIKHHRTAMRTHRDALKKHDETEDFTIKLALQSGGSDDADILVLQDTLMSQLYASKGLALPGAEETPTPPWDFEEELVQAAPDPEPEKPSFIDADFEDIIDVVSETGEDDTSSSEETVLDASRHAEKDKTGSVDSTAGASLREMKLSGD